VVRRRSEFRVYAGRNSPAFRVYKGLSRCAVWTRLKAKLQTASAPNMRLLWAARQGKHQVVCCMGGIVKRSLRSLAMADCPCAGPSPRPTGLDAAIRLRDFAFALGRPAWRLDVPVAEVVYEATEPVAGSPESLIE